MSEDTGEEAAVACQGAPRDQGLDQGNAFRAEIREEVGRLPWRARIEAALGGAIADPLSARVDRDLRRHFPHMAERQGGLARGAGVRPGDLSGLLTRELCAASGPGRAASAGLLAALVPKEGGPAILGRTLPERCVVRTSAPDHDYASREFVLPWLVPPLAGRNEEGLCVVGAALPIDGIAEVACAAPALLLVQDCLQRFDSTEKAIEWCVGRPAGGRAALLIADAAGDVAEMAIDGEDRHVERPTDGLLVVSRTPAEGDAVRKALLEARGEPSRALQDALGARGGDRVVLLGTGRR